MVQLLAFLKSKESRLIMLSFLMFFVELTLIRWASAHIYNLFFFTNFVIMASFLGMGIGFLRSSRSPSLLPFSPLLLVLIVFCCYYYAVYLPPRIDPLTQNINYYGRYFKDNIYPIIITLPIIFILIAALMAAIADGVKRAFAEFKPLKAYRLETLGSLAGIIVFSLLALLETPPLIWGMLISMVYCALFLFDKGISKFIFSAELICLAFLLVIFSHEHFTQHSIWSAYYRIATAAYAKDSYVVNVNGLIQQIIEPESVRRKIKPFYVLPYQHKLASVPLDNVLIIGAGTGGDVALALAQGAKHVDAVEIDPALYALGVKLNPDRPYTDPRVQMHINDGRAFLEQTKTQYDMIIFALTDSLMLIPGQSSLRLENYLYTVQSIAKAKAHLKPQGIFTIYNYYRPDWLVDKLAYMLNLVFGNAPCLDQYSAKDYWATVLTSSNSQQSLQCASYWQAGQKNNIIVATDNHPFIYLADTKFPLMYLLFLGFIFCLAAVAIKFVGSSYYAIFKYFDLFLMGAAFFLLETKNIINFALVFGTTWFVNALVFIGIVFSIFLAIECTAKITAAQVNALLPHFLRPFKSYLLYFFLMLSLLLAWLIPNEYLLHLAFLPRFFAATLLAFSPIFIANLIFAQRFQAMEVATEAFGANLLGAVLGGILEYLSLLLGYQHLLLLIAILYSAAIFIMLYLRRIPRLASG